MPAPMACPAQGSALFQQALYEPHSPTSEIEAVDKIFRQYPANDHPFHDKGADHVRNNA